MDTQTTPQRLTAALDAAAARARQAGHKAMKHPIASILSLSMLAGVSATIMTYSQTSNPNTQTTPMKLVDVTGHIISATILSRDAKGITVLNEEGKTISIPWDNLSLETLTEMGSTRNQPTRDPVTKRLILPPEELARRVAMQERSRENLHSKGNDEREALKGLSKQEIVRRFATNDPKVMGLIQRLKQSWENKTGFFTKTTDPQLSQLGARGRSGDPRWREFNSYFLDIVSSMEIKSPKEEEWVSLKPEFEKLGFKAREQERYMCWIYAPYHMAQYTFAKDGRKPPTITELKAGLISRGLNPNDPAGGSKEHLIGTLNELSSKRLHVFHVIKPACNQPLGLEMIKHQLRNGRPCLVRKWEQIGDKGGYHMVVVTGFHTKDRKTTWEIIDSNNVANENGFSSMPDILDDGEGAISFWFE